MGFSFQSLLNLKSRKGKRVRRMPERLYLLFGGRGRKGSIIYSNQYESLLQNLLVISLKCRFPESITDVINQKLLGWCPGICTLQIYSGDSQTNQNLRITSLEKTKQNLWTDWCSPSSVTEAQTLLPFRSTQGLTASQNHLQRKTLNTFQAA